MMRIMHVFGFLNESDDYDNMSDDELEMATNPSAGRANPFEPAAKAKPVLPKPSGGVKTSIPATKAPMKGPGPNAGIVPDVGMTKPNPKPNAPSSISPISGHVKPNYPGSFVGQSVDFADKVQTKGTAWQDKATGDMRYGAKRPVQTKVRYTWDGKEWLNDDMWKLKMAQKAGHGDKIATTPLSKVFGTAGPTDTKKK
jgi:hypothetical protein